MRETTKSGVKGLCSALTALQVINDALSNKVECKVTFRVRAATRLVELAALSALPVYHTHCDALCGS